MTVPPLPDPPFLSGEPFWYWLGGRPATDLANTVRERWGRAVDCLVSDADVVAWLAEARLLSARSPAPAGLLAEARALREAIDAAVRATVAGVAADPAAIALIDDWLVLAGSRPQLVLRADGRPHLSERAPADSPRRALGMVALDAATMLGTAQRDRIRLCASETCSARFYDRSPAGRRRWCSMAACGNVAKARRHRARSAGEQA